MKNISDFRRLEAVTPTQDDETWHQLHLSLREQFPNPHRNGCPGLVVLERLARKSMRLNEAEAWLDHFSQCSPCFCDLEALQLRYRNRRKLTWVFAATAAIVLCSSWAFWVIYSHEKAINPRTRVDRPGSTFTHIQQAQPPLVSVHLEDVSANRDSGKESGTNLQHLPRGPISLSIYLPPGSDGGTYEVQFLRKRTDSAPLARFEGTVQVENGTPVLHTTPDLSGLEPGNYILAFRLVGGWWRYCRIAIS